MFTGFAFGKLGRIVRINEVVYIFGRVKSLYHAMRLSRSLGHNVSIRAWLSLPEVSNQVGLGQNVSSDVCLCAHMHVNVCKFKMHFQTFALDPELYFWYRSCTRVKWWWKRWALTPKDNFNKLANCFSKYVNWQFEQP